MARKSFTEDSAKERTRQEIVNSIHKTWPDPSERATLQAASMPSVQWTEAEMYARAGLQPNNITVIENDPEDHARMWQENQARPEQERWNMFPTPLGMQETIAALERPQDIIVLDPYGGISDLLVSTIEEIFRGGHLNRNKAVLSVNRLARESSLGKRRVGEVLTIHDHAYERRDLVLEVMRGRGLHELNEETERMQEKISEYDGKALREDGLVSLVVQESTFGSRVKVDGPLVRAMAWDFRFKTLVEGIEDPNMEDIRRAVHKALLPGEDATVAKATIGQRIHVRSRNTELDHVAYNLLSLQQILEGNPMKIVDRRALTYISDSGKRYVMDVFQLSNFESQRLHPDTRRKFYELLGFAAKYDGQIDIDADQMTIKVSTADIPTKRDQKRCRRVAENMNPRKLFEVYASFLDEGDESEHAKRGRRTDLTPSDSSAGNGSSKRSRVQRTETERSNGYRRSKDLSPEEKEAVYDALRAGTADEDITDRFNLNPRSIPAFRAHITMADEGIKPWEKRRRNGNGNGKRDGNEGAKPAYETLPIDEAVLVYEWVREGNAVEELEELFPDHYDIVAFIGGQVEQDLTAATSGRKRDWFFKNIVRPYVLERDGYQCVNDDCGISDEAHREQYPTGLHVHHIDDDHQNNDPANCATVCIPCHQKTNVTQLARNLNPRLKEVVQEREAAYRQTLEATVAESI